MSIVSNRLRATVRVALASLMIAGGAAATEAKTLYVNGATGNDSTTWAANGPSNPWRTIGRAAWGSTNKSAPNGSEAARAGDVVNIAGGTYTTVGNMTGGGGGRWDVAYNPVNEGTASAPIRFVCTPGPCVLVYSSGAGPMIGASERDYIEWSGFTISEATAPSRSDTGPVTFNMVTGGAIESSILTGNANSHARVGDNYPGVRVEDATGVRIANNVIRDFGGNAGDENHNGIETYRSYPLTIENNYIANCGAGIYMKAVHTSTLAVDTVIIRFNIFEGSQTQVRVLRMPMTQARPMLIYQNIFLNWVEAGMWWNAFDNGVTDPKWIRVFNNTFVGTTGAAVGTYNWMSYQPGTNGLFRNNVTYGGQYAIRMDTGNASLDTQKDRFDFENNVYFGYTSGFATVAGQGRTVAQWRAFGQDLAAVTADPLFVNRTGRDFHLQAGSPARTAGRVVHAVGGANGAVIPAGAYITGNEQIGPTTGYTPTPPTPPPPAPNAPAAPRNVRVIR